MDRITLQDLHTLWNHPAAPRISIYMPTHRTGAETQTHPVRLKNLVAEAIRRLVEQGLRPPEARELMAPVEALVGDQAFWKEQREGLAVFRAEGLFRTVRLAHAPAERVIVGARFHTRALLPHLRNNTTFHVLALSQNAVRLLRATAHDVEAVPLPDAPGDLADFLRYEERQQDNQYRAGGQGGSVSVGGREDNRKDAQLRYLRAVAKAVAAALRDEPGPLVFAGVEMLFAPFRDALDDARLIATPLAGNPDHLSPQVLRDGALNLLRPLDDAEGEAVAANYRRLAGTGQTAVGLEAVLAAAEAGRVDTLLLRPETERWGHFDEGGGLTLHEIREPGDDELLDRAASLTLRANGRVLTLPETLTAQPEITDGVAAVLRY